MKFLGYVYRFVSNFVFLALVYYSLNLIEKYPQRAMLAVLILVYAGMHSASALRSSRTLGACTATRTTSSTSCSTAW